MTGAAGNTNECLHPISKWKVTHKVESNESEKRKSRGARGQSKRAAEGVTL